MSSEQAEVEQGYKIGAVSRLTGISPESLRIWERRYQVVTPARSAGGERLYSQQDVARLTLIKTLVDQGDSISRVATLDHNELQKRVAAIYQRHPSLPATSDRPPLRVALLGLTWERQFKQLGDELVDVIVVGAFANEAAFGQALSSMRADLLILDIPTLHPDTAARVMEWMKQSQARHALVVYRFSNAESIQRLPSSTCTALPGPVDVKTLQRYWQSLPGLTSDGYRLPANQPPVQTRRFDDATLARIASQSSAIRCECPRHLANLITSLASFEQYSLECESRSAQDAALHAYLHETAAQARVLIEAALTRVIEVDQIELD